MDSFEIGIYIVISIIWLIVQNSRKKKQKAAAEKRASQAEYETVEESPVETPQAEKSLIDEILKEIKQEREQEKYTEDVNRPVPVYEESKPENTIDYNQVLKDMEKKDLSSKESRFSEYELDVNKDPYEISEDADNPYANMLFDEEDGPQKAIILSEIINRKHF
jgi:FtsZ-interacting cell division protein ZipA